MQIHIGHLIREELRRQGHNNEWLADHIGVTPRTLQRIYNRPSIDTHLLLRISKVLHTNLFLPYFDFVSSMTDVVA